MKPADDNHDLRLSSELLRDSLLYREMQAEHEEILKHKWFESEKAGRDIGFDLAMIDWLLKYRSRWRESRREHRAIFCATPDR